MNMNQHRIPNRFNREHVRILPELCHECGTTVLQSVLGSDIAADQIAASLAGHMVCRSCHTRAPHLCLVGPKGGLNDWGQEVEDGDSVPEA